MTDRKYYLLAEFDVKPDLLEETKAIFSELLPKVMEEEGCEEIYTTTSLDDPNKLVLFEVFSSREAHDWHMEQPYTRQLATDLNGKLAAAPRLTELNRF